MGNPPESSRRIRGAVTQSRILSLQTALHFAGVAITKMQASLGRFGVKPKRPGSLAAASFVVPETIWATIRPGIRMLAQQFGLAAQERSLYASPDGIEIEFVELRELTPKQQTVRWFEANDNAWTGVARIARDIGLGRPVLANVFYKNKGTFESRPSRCSWHEYRLRKEPDPEPD